MAHVKELQSKMSGPRCKPQWQSQVYTMCLTILVRIGTANKALEFLSSGAPFFSAMTLCKGTILRDTLLPI